MGKIFRRIHYLLNRRKLERELELEMASHREMLAGDRRAAFGNPLLLREDARDAWGWTWLVHDGTGLAVMSTPNQDSPISESSLATRSPLSASLDALAAAADASSNRPSRARPMASATSENDEIT